MAPSSKPQALANKLLRMDADIVARLDKFFDVFEDMRNNTFSIFESKIRDYKFVESESKARALAADIEADIKATTQNIFAIQKYARELADQAEQLERVADGMYMRKNDLESKMYRAVKERSGEKWD
jgi:hypothetical protein